VVFVILTEQILAAFFSLSLSLSLFIPLKSSSSLFLFLSHGIFYAFMSHCSYNEKHQYNLSFICQQRQGITIKNIEQNISYKFYVYDYVSTEYLDLLIRVANIDAEVRISFL
jgi:hypothetical protein